MSLEEEVLAAYNQVKQAMKGIKFDNIEEHDMFMAAGFRSAWGLAYTRAGKAARLAFTRPLNDSPSSSKETPEAPTAISIGLSEKKAGEGNRVGGGSSQELCSATSISFTTLTKPLSESDGRTGIERIPPRSNPAPYGGGTVGGDKSAIVESSAHAVPHARAPAQPSICPTCSRPLPEKDGEVCGGR